MSDIQLAHANCPAHEEGEAPVMLDRGEHKERSPYTMLLFCPDCKMCVAVTVMREPSLAAKAS